MRSLCWALGAGAALLVACVPTAVPDPVTATPAGPARLGKIAPDGADAAGAPPARETPRGGALRVQFLDVGQGDSSLVTTDDHHAVLIDAGPPDGAPRVARALSALGDAELDAVILSHAHADHVGDLDVLLGRLPLRLWIEPGFAHHPVHAYTRALAALGARQIPVKHARRGDHFALGAHAELHVLLPREPLFHGTRSDVNANSVVVRLDHHARGGDARFLFAGDAEAPTEQRLLEDAGAVRADVLKVAHHGSKHASTAALLLAVAPRLGVISCGVGNDYGHPHAETLARLEAQHVTIARTDVQGDVTVTSDDQGISWTTARPGSDSAMHAPGTHRAAHDAEAP